MQNKSRGAIKSHPLYWSYHSHCVAKTIHPKWKSDFWGFADAIGEKQVGMSLCRLDESKPLDENNFIWKDNARRLNRPELLDVPTKSNKSGKEKHPLYHIHYHHRRQSQLCEEWRADFWKFVEDVGEKKEGYSFAKIDKSKPLSKDNFYWKEQIRVNSDDHKEKRAAYGRIWRVKNPDASRNIQLKKIYGITVTEYDAMYEKQNGVCAICGNPETVKHVGKDTIRRLAVDHNHSTGKVRALLCCGCNQGIGNFQEDIQRLEKAVQYLKSFKTKDVPSNI